MADTVSFECLTPEHPILSRDERRARSVLAFEAPPATRAALFRLLARAGIVTVTVAFDGADDAGQIDAMAAHGDTFTVDLASWSSVAHGLGPHDASLDGRRCPVAKAIAVMVFALLDEHYDGWKINEGSFGTFTFDIAARTIRLDYNERVMTFVSSEREFRGGGDGISRRRSDRGSSVTVPSARARPRRKRERGVGTG